MSALESCAVCGRTILAGERTRPFFSPDGERREVCELCRERAEYLGWVPEELGAGPPAQPARRRGGLRALLGRGRHEEPVEDPGTGGERGGGGGPAGDPPPAGPGGEPAAEQAPPGGAGEPPEPPPALPSTPAPEPPPGPRRNPDPAARGAGVGRPEPLSENPTGRAERAVARFNASEESRTVAGLIRSLGMPWVSVGAAAGSPSEVRITVAWELCWYQWGVDIRDEKRSVYPIDKGREISELDSSAQHWNAVADEQGRLHTRSLATGGSEGGGP
ncbi:MAG: hypothetical protein U0R52_10170 [Solirubrobacterales bacterium]